VRRGVAARIAWIYSVNGMTWGTVELEPEVRCWLEGLPTQQFATVAFSVDLLVDQGPLLGEPYTRQLDGKLRELRFHLQRGAVRLTYWIAPGRRIVLLTVFRKSSGVTGRSFVGGGWQNRAPRRPTTQPSSLSSLAGRCVGSVNSAAGHRPSWLEPRR
jgi:hypothetical protein